MSSPTQQWRRIVLQRDWDALPALLHDDVTYHTPAQLQPLHGKDAVIGVLRLVFGAFDSFTYLRHFVSDDGVALEFSAHVGDSALFGIDLLRFDADGRMVELIVMLRPREGLDALIAALMR
ncbi:nuclear transport factor 2 family protein [Xanthomonas arboricola]|uniref:nuclear transport factor 2 family protein n=1 Tax=Xanthomonas arboricola TaxID=56448 RepID=UPI00137B60BA|nr:nuclear transport factor 2 family protein [Xanthomonas arboricola]